MIWAILSYRVLIHQNIARRNVLYDRWRYTLISIVFTALDDLPLRPRKQPPQSFVVGRVDDLPPARVLVQGSLRPEGVVVFEQCCYEGDLFGPRDVDVVRAHAKLRRALE